MHVLDQDMDVSGVMSISIMPYGVMMRGMPGEGTYRWVVALSALGLIRNAGLHDGGGLRRQWRLLRPAQTLGLVIAGLPVTPGRQCDASAAPVGIFAFIERLRGASGSVSAAASAAVAISAR
jgi:hypothetical protein